MSLTYSTVTHQYQNADQTPASGTVEFTLSEAITNGSVTLVPGTHLSSQLDASGNLSQRLASTLDTGTISEGLAQWRVDERIAGAGVRSYDIAVPSGGVTVDLGALMPFSTPEEAG